MAIEEVKDIAEKARTSKIANNAIDIYKAGKFTDVPPCTFPEILKAFGDLLAFTDFDVVKIILAAVIANRLRGDPVWLFVVGPSASGKTEFINALDKLPGTYLLSLVSPSTFLSGKAGRQEASLLKRLPREFIFLQKDFTSILNLRSENKNEILSQLREIFDGKFVKETGEGNTKAWEGKAGFITGVTLEIENNIMLSTKFGDRFLYYRLPAIDEKAAMTKVSDVLFQADELRTQIQKAVCGYLQTIDYARTSFIYQPHFLTGLQNVMQFLIRARGSVTRDNYGNKEVIGVSLPEGPMRFYKEILQLGNGLMAMSGTELTEADYLLLTKTAFDAIPSIRMKILDELYSYSDLVTTRALAQRVLLPTATVRRILEDLEYHHLAQRMAEKKGNPDQWSMPEDIKKMMAYRYASSGLQAAKDLPPSDTEQNDAADLVNKPDGWMADVVPPPL